IEMLKNNEDQWVLDSRELEQLALDYYSRLYSLDDVEPVATKLPPEGFMSLSQADKTELLRCFSAGEVEKAVRCMGKFKAPGPDEY
ncbi:hypothetical protein J0672_24310, partial [Vibrio parahaemolyticus]|nr:hypothetical protein [Vibrio parahaemolyticus]